MKPGKFANELRNNAAIKTFKKAMKETANPTISRFQVWDTNSLKTLLVENNVQIRGSANTPHEILVRICDEVFGPEEEDDDDDDDDEAEEGYDEKHSSSSHMTSQYDSCGKASSTIGGNKERIQRMNSSLTFEDLAKLNKAAIRIQRIFVASRKRKYEQRFDSHMNNQDIDYGERDDSGYDYEENQPQHLSESIQNKEQDEEGGYSHEFRYSENINLEDIEEETWSIHKTDKPLPNGQSPNYRHNATASYDDKDHELDDELNTAWRKPSWKFAKKYEAENRPHKSGKDMKTYGWKQVTLGRHCTMGGCGEQLDLWNEGATSEFSQFGSGITNYFKVNEFVSSVAKLLLFKNMSGAHYDTVFLLRYWVIIGLLGHWIIGLLGYWVIGLSVSKMVLLDNADSFLYSYSRITHQHFSSIFWVRV